MSDRILRIDDLLGAKLLSRELVTPPVFIDGAISGKEARSSWGSTIRYRYRLSLEALRTTSRSDYQRAIEYFTRHFGALDSFLFKDPDDYTQTAHGFGVGDNSTLAFQLQRSLLGKVYDKLGGPWAVSSTPRTNLALRSQEFDNASWTKTRSSVTANAVVAPDGTKTADKLVEDNTASNTHMAEQSITLAGSTTYTHSIFVKAATRTQFQINIPAVGAALFDVSAGTVLGSGGGTAAITAGFGGWYRCEFTAGSGSGGATAIQYQLAAAGSASYSGDNTSGLYIWGAQTEAAASSTEYVATTTAAGVSNPSYWPSYSSGFEPVKDLDLAALLIYVDGTLKTHTTDYTVSSTGVVTFESGAKPGSGAVLTWTGTYYRRVRLDGPVSAEWIVSRIYRVGQLDLVSVV